MTVPGSNISERLSASKFRMRFKLEDKERGYIAGKGWDAIAGQVRSIITSRLAPANPVNDGKQTPMRGHVVFLAQHATATCCRGCLSKWHGIQAGHELTENEIKYVVDFIMKWLHDKAGDLSSFPTTPDFWNYQQ